MGIQKKRPHFTLTTFSQLPLPPFLPVNPHPVAELNSRKENYTSLKGGAVHPSFCSGIYASSTDRHSSSKTVLALRRLYELVYLRG